MQINIKKNYKWVEDLDRYFSKENIDMVKKAHV